MAHVTPGSYGRAHETETGRGNTGMTMRDRLEELRDQDVDDLAEVRAVVFNLIDVLVDEHNDPTGERDELRARVARIETALLGIAGTASIIDRRTPE